MENEMGELRQNERSTNRALLVLVGLLLILSIGTLFYFSWIRRDSTEQISKDELSTAIEELDSEIEISTAALSDFADFDDEELAESSDESQNLDEAIDETGTVLDEFSEITEDDFDDFSHNEFSE